MIEPLFHHDAMVAQWVASQPPFNPERGFGNCTAIGWVEDGVLIAGTVYHGYEPDAGIIELSSASQSPRWLTRRVLDVMFRYPFDDIGVQMVILRTSARNQNDSGRGINRLTKAFGFQQVVIPRLYGRHEDGIVSTLTEEQWRAARIAFGPKSG